MKKISIRTFIVPLLMVALALAPKVIYAKDAQSKKKPVRLVVFNQTGQKIDLQILVDGKPVYEEKVEIADRKPAIVDERSFLIKPGKHEVVLKDVSRKFEETKKFELKEFINFLVFLDKNRSSLEVNDRDKINFQ